MKDILKDFEILFCVTGIHLECNYKSTRSTHPVMVYEKTAICKSRLVAIKENHGNMQEAEQAFRHWFVDRLHQGLVLIQRRLVIRSCCEKFDNSF